MNAQERKVFQAALLGNSLADYINALNYCLDIPEGYHVIAVYDNDDEETIAGYTLVGDEYTPDGEPVEVMSIEDLFEKYDKD